MGIEPVVLMLALARIGAIHVVIFAGFSSRAIADRIELSGARFIFTQDYGLRRGNKINLKEMVCKGIDMLDKKVIEKIIVLKKDKDTKLESSREIDFEEFLELGKGNSEEIEWVESNEFLFLLPTSGTTAKPKVTVHCHGGYQVYIYSMAKWIYGLKDIDIWFCTSDIGWIVGHSYNVYGPLLVGCSTILYEGTPDYPERDMWWKIIEKYKVTGFWTSPTGIRGLMRLGLEEAKKHDLSSLKRVFSAGEVLNPAAWEWMQKEVFEDKIPVIDHMWQTETAGPIVANPYGISLIPIKPGSAGLPVPGVIGDVIDEHTGNPQSFNKKGIFVVRKPFPGLTPTLFNEHSRYMQEYWERTEKMKGVYFTGDAASKDEDGYIWFAGRADEVIKISAHRIGTVEIESALITHPAVIEAGVCGVPDELRGEVACAFVVLKSGYKPTEELKKELKEHVKNLMGAIVVIKDIEFVNILPKTRSGKIMRRVMKRLWTGVDLGDLSTIEEEASLEEIREAVEKIKKYKEE